MFIWICPIDNLYDSMPDGLAVVRARTAQAAAQLLYEVLNAELDLDSEGLWNGMQWLQDNMKQIGIAQDSTPAVIEWLLPT